MLRTVTVLEAVVVGIGFISDRAAASRTLRLPRSSLTPLACGPMAHSPPDDDGPKTVLQECVILNEVSEEIVLRRGLLCFHTFRDGRFDNQRRCQL